MSEDISIVCDDQVVETKIKLNNETIKVIWDLESPFTPIGQLVYFSQFLETADMFSTFIESCSCGASDETQNTRHANLRELLFYKIEVTHSYPKGSKR